MQTKRCRDLQSSSYQRFMGHDLEQATQQEGEEVLWGKERTKNSWTTPKIWPRNIETQQVCVRVQREELSKVKVTRSWSTFAQEKIV